jgi:membrane protein implicated in regulation of membrane protease activity
MKRLTLIWFLLIMFGAAPAALAYVGPGAGLSLLGALWGLLLAVGAAVAFIILWPLRRMRQRARIQKNINADADPTRRV